MAIICAAILAGGSGKRMNTDLPKQFMELDGKPIISYSLNMFASHPDIDTIVVTVPSDYTSHINEILQTYPVSKDIIIVSGGSTRQQSSLHALNASGCTGDDIILFHDAARPFVSTAIISDCISAARTYGACGVYIPVTDTIAEIYDNRVHSIPPRDTLYNTQTPQAFKAEIIRLAHTRFQNHESTDDAGLVLKAGYPVYKVEGNNKNFKITTTLDLVTALHVLKQ